MVYVPFSTLRHSVCHAFPFSTTCHSINKAIYFPFCTPSFCITCYTFCILHHLTPCNMLYIPSSSLPYSVCQVVCSLFKTRAGTRGGRDGQLPWAPWFTVGIGAPSSFCKEVVTAAVIVTSERLLGVGSHKLAYHEWGGAV